MRCRLLLLIPIIVLYQTTISFGSENQHWNDLSLRTNLISRFKLDLLNRARWREIAFDNAFQNCFQTGLNYKCSDNLDVLIAYRFDIFATSTRSGTENRFLANLSFKFPDFFSISQSVSQRTELRYFNKIIDDHLRIRVRYILSRRLIIANKKFVPNLSYELFWDDIANQLNRQRVYAGISTYISSIFAVRLTVIGQYDNGRESIYILNTGLNMSL